MGEIVCTGTMMTAVSIKRNPCNSFELSETVVNISVDCRAGAVVECRVV